MDLSCFSKMEIAKYRHGTHGTKPTPWFRILATDTGKNAERGCVETGSDGRILPCSRLQNAHLHLRTHLVEQFIIHVILRPWSQAGRYHTVYLSQGALAGGGKVFADAHAGQEHDILRTSRNLLANKTGHIHTILYEVLSIRPEHSWVYRLLSAKKRYYLRRRTDPYLKDKHRFT